MRQTFSIKSIILIKFKKLLSIRMYDPSYLLARYLPEPDLKLLQVANYSLLFVVSRRVRTALCSTCSMQISREPKFYVRPDSSLFGNFSGDDCTSCGILLSLAGFLAGLHIFFLSPWCHRPTPRKNKHCVPIRQEPVVVDSIRIILSRRN